MDLHERAPGRPERVERAGLDQRLDRALVGDVDGNLRRGSRGTTSKDASARAATIGVDDVRADVAHGAEPEADVLADGGEVADGLADIRREHLDAHAAALVEVHRELVLGVAHAREEGGHVLGGVVRLQVRGPVRDQPVRGGVRLVEGVVGERLEHLPQRVLRRRRVAVRGHAREEVLLLLVELGLLLLAHRAPQDVGLAEREAGELLRGRHHLLLIDDQAVACRRGRRASGSSSSGWIGTISCSLFLRSA